jgi:hypothetical protein
VATVPYPLDDIDLHNTAQLGPHLLPGLFSCDGLPVGRVTDPKKPGKKSGGKSADKGYKPAKFKGKLRMWSRDHHARFQQILPQINPRREGATNDPFVLRCAQTIEAGITTVIVQQIVLGPWNTKGERTIEFDFEEWFPKAKTVKAGTGKPKEATQQSSPTDLRNVSYDRLQHPGLAMLDPSDPAEVVAKLFE